MMAEGTVGALFVNYKNEWALKNWNLFRFHDVFVRKADERLRAFGNAYRKRREKKFAAKGIKNYHFLSSSASKN
jgi:hypothetical protein